jgi:hypothetical protein
MITPDKFPSKASIDAGEQSTLEQHIDRHLKINQRRNEWPLFIPHLRTAIREENVCSVHDKYRAAGWRVVRQTDGFIFDLPETT